VIHDVRDPVHDRRGRDPGEGRGQRVGEQQPGQRPDPDPDLERAEIMRQMLVVDAVVGDVVGKRLRASERPDAEHEVEQAGERGHKFGENAHAWWTITAAKV
jgi:hypothetical protein